MHNCKFVCLNDLKGHTQTCMHARCMKTKLVTGPTYITIPLKNPIHAYYACVFPSKQQKATKKACFSLNYWLKMQNKMQKYNNNNNNNNTIYNWILWLAGVCGNNVQIIEIFQLDAKKFFFLDFIATTITLRFMLLLSSNKN